MKDIFIAIQFYLTAFVIALMIAFLIKGMQSATRHLFHKKEEITKESEV